VVSGCATHPPRAAGSRAMLLNESQTFRYEKLPGTPSWRWHTIARLVVRRLVELRRERRTARHGRSSMSTTSSAGLRPFGSPRVSPQESQAYSARQHRAVSIFSRLRKDGVVRSPASFEVKDTGQNQTKVLRGGSGALT